LFQCHADTGKTQQGGCYRLNLGRCGEQLGHIAKQVRGATPKLEARADLNLVAVAAALLTLAVILGIYAP